jgi:hypothetical protein
MVGVAWAIVGACAVASLVLVAVGVVRCLRVAGVLRKRMDGYKDLPLMRGIAATVARLEATQAHLVETDATLARAHAAVDSMQTSFADLIATYAGAFALYARALDDLNAVRAAFSRRPRGT